MKGINHVEYWTCICGKNCATGCRVCPVCGQAKPDNNLAGSKSTVKERSGQQALVIPARTSASVGRNYPPLCVRITQLCPREIDADNISGGLKQLQDAIAESIGRPGDSTKEGFIWQCRWERSETKALIIEIFEEK